MPLVKTWTVRLARTPQPSGHPIFFGACRRFYIYANFLASRIASFARPDLQFKIIPIGKNIGMSDLCKIENLATISRATCGWKKAHLPLEWVRKYWRDVHSPAIARRAGVYDYRHFQFGSVDAKLLQPISGIEYTAAADAQLMWTSDVRYTDEAGLSAFGNSPDGEVKAQLLGDIDLIVDRSTTYKSVGQNAHTYVDHTGVAAPQGPVTQPCYALFFRQAGNEEGFRNYLRKLALRWAGTMGVLRVRLSLFDVPDMEAERKAGYPIKTHPVEQQYQAWIDVVVSDQQVMKRLITDDDHLELKEHVKAIHTYPVNVVYTSNYAGRPTLVGLRGYAAFEAIRALNGMNQAAPSLLEWLYGPVAKGGPLDGTRI
jgi:hypothetical protein